MWQSNGMKQKVCPNINPMYEHELKRLAKYDKKNFPIFQRQLTKHRQQAQTVNQTTVAIIVANPCRSGMLLEPLT